MKPFDFNNYVKTNPLLKEGFQGDGDDFENDGMSGFRGSSNSNSTNNTTSSKKIKIYSSSGSNKESIVDLGLIDQLAKQILPASGYGSWEKYLANIDYKSVINAVAKEVLRLGTLETDRISLKEAKSKPTNNIKDLEEELEELSIEIYRVEEELEEREDEDDDDNDDLVDELNDLEKMRDKLVNKLEKLKRKK